VRLGIVAAGTAEVEVVRLTFDDIRALRAEAAPVAAPTPVAMQPAPVESGSWSVQLGAFQAHANADALRERAAVLLQQADGIDAAARSPRIEHDGSIFRVLVGAVADRAAAQQLAAQLARQLGTETVLMMR
jgi:cell division septation protein DedD